MNDIENDIEILKDIYPSQKEIKTGEYNHVADALDDAISALEKQIPKKPIKINSVEFKGSIRMSFKSADCPVCGGHIDTDDEPFFCSHRGCGQAIDWSV